MSTHKVSHGSASASLGGNFPYLIDFLLVNWHSLNFLQAFSTSPLRFFQVKCCLIVASVLVEPGWHKDSWYHCTHLCCKVAGTTIFPFLTINSLVFPPPGNIFWEYCLSSLIICLKLSSCCWCTIRVLKFRGKASGGRSSSSNENCSIFIGEELRSSIGNLLRASATTLFSPLMYFRSGLYSSRDNRE